MSMSELAKRKPLLVLSALLALTAASWLLGYWPALAPGTLGALLIILAFVKARLVIVHFMETHATHVAVRLAFEAWILVVGGITIGIYLKPA